MAAEQCLSHVRRSCPLIAGDAQQNIVT